MTILDSALESAELPSEPQRTRGRMPSLRSSPYLASVVAGCAAMLTYLCMYAFRKPFSAATFPGEQLAGMDYKAWLVMAQVLGYACSKFIGIRVIAEMRRVQRWQPLLLLIGFAWLALLGFALVPRPWNIAFLFLNGLPLGMIWGVVFSYLEGRRATELMGTILASSLIFATGLVKTVGRFLLFSGVERILDAVPHRPDVRAAPAGLRGAAGAPAASQPPPMWQHAARACRCRRRNAAVFCAASCRGWPWSSCAMSASPWCAISATASRRSC